MNRGAGARPLTVVLIALVAGAAGALVTLRAVGFWAAPPRSTAADAPPGAGPPGPSLASEALPEPAASGQRTRNAPSTSGPAAEAGPAPGRGAPPAEGEASTGAASSAPAAPHRADDAPTAAANGFAPPLVWTAGGPIARPASVDTRTEGERGAIAGRVTVPPHLGPPIIDPLREDWGAPLRRTAGCDRFVRDPLSIPTHGDLVIGDDGGLKDVIVQVRPRGRWLGRGSELREDPRSIRIEFEPCFIGPPIVVAAPGDRLVLSSASPGLLYWHRPEFLRAGPDGSDDDPRIETLELSGDDDLIIELSPAEEASWRFSTVSVFQPEVHERTTKLIVQSRRLWALTDEDGRFEIPELAPDDYEIYFYHPWAGGHRRWVSVDEGVARIDYAVRDLEPPRRTHVLDLLP